MTRVSLVLGLVSLLGFPPLARGQILFHDPAGRESLIQACTTSGSPQQVAFQLLQDSYLGAGGEALLPQALAYLATGERSYQIGALAELMALRDQASWGEDHGDGTIGRGGQMAQAISLFAVALDWMGPSLPGREGMRDKLTAEACLLYEAAAYGGENVAEGWDNDYIHAYLDEDHAQVLAALAFAGLVLQADEPALTPCLVNDLAGGQSQAGPTEWLAWAQGEMDKTFILLDEGDGSWPNGDSHQVAILGWFLYATRAMDLNRATAYHQSPWLQALPAFAWANTMPDNIQNTLLNGGDYLPQAREEYALVPALRLLASILNNEGAQSLADQLATGRTLDATSAAIATNLALEIIFMDDQVASQAPNLIRHHGSDRETVMLRSSSGQDALALGIMAGPPGGHAAYLQARSNLDLNTEPPTPTGAGQEPVDHSFFPLHAHGDANSLYLYTPGSWLLPESPGDSQDPLTPEASCTQSHNTILVSGVGQIGSCAAGMVPQNIPGFWGMEGEGVAGETGLTHAYAGEGDYVMGDATRAYPASLGLTSFTRHLLFLRPSTVVVVDRLQATAEQTFTWVGHTVDAPFFDVGRLRANAKNNAVLSGVFLAPQGLTFSSIPSPPTGTDEAHQLRRLIDPDDGEISEFHLDAPPARETTFVAVLFATTQTGFASLPQPTSLSSLQADGVTMVSVDQGVSIRTDIAISRDTQAPAVVGSYSLSGQAFALRTRGGEPSWLFLALGQSLEDSQGALVEGLSPQSSVEVRWEESLMVQGEVERFRIRAPDIQVVTLNGVDTPFRREGAYVVVPESEAPLDAGVVNDGPLAELPPPLADLSDFDLPLPGDVDQLPGQDGPVVDHDIPIPPPPPDEGPPFAGCECQGPGVWQSI